MVTVAIPTYNGEKYLESAVESIINQTYQVDKILFHDDDSTDNTKKIIIGLKERFHELSIEYYLNEKNQGYASNWNNCFKYCKTKYLVILHQDDLLKKESIEKQLKFLLKNTDIAFVGGNEDKINEKGDFLIKRNNEEKIKIYRKGQIYEFVKNEGSYIPCSSVFFDMEKIREVGLFDEQVLASDELYWPKVLQKYPIAIFSESLIIRRMHTEQAGSSDLVNKYNQIIASAKAQYQIANYETNKVREKATLKLLRKKFALNCIRIAFVLFKSKKGKPISISYIKEALSEFPQIVLTKVFFKYLIKVIF